MAKRAMNNEEKAAAKLLKEKGFSIFWFESRSSQGSGYYAIHEKLVSQYCIRTCSNEALQDLEQKLNGASVRID